MTIRNLFGILSFGCLTAFADGADSSGGGRLVGHENNPWFLAPPSIFDSTFSIPYCIEQSVEFSLNHEQAAAEVEAALLDWTRTIEALSPGYVNDSLGTNPKTLAIRFKRTPCAENIPLKFFLGKITDKIRQDLGTDLRTYIGYSKRTDFDETTGQSRGYVWLASDLGANSFEGKKGPFWDAGTVVYNVLLHELGHVFGFQHNSDRILMAPDFPERMVKLAHTDCRFLCVGGDIRSLPPGTLLLSTEYLRTMRLGSAGSEFCSVNGLSKDNLKLLKNVFETPSDTAKGFCIRAESPTSLMLTLHEGADFGVKDSKVVARRTANANMETGWSARVEGYYRKFGSRNSSVFIADNDFKSMFYLNGYTLSISTDNLKGVAVLWISTSTGIRKVTLHAQSFKVTK